MLERALVILALAAAAIVLVLAIRAWNRGRVRRLLGTPMWSELGLAPDGRPTLVTFSTPSCAACHQAQTPAVQRVARQIDVRQVEVNAAARPEIARAFGVLTVPATVVLAPAGQLVAVNQGFAPTAKLVEQILSV
jgi:hypothetical protein